MKAETRVMWSQAEDHLGPPCAGRIKEDFSFRASGVGQPCQYLEFGRLPSKTMTENISALSQSVYGPLFPQPWEKDALGLHLYISSSFCPHSDCSLLHTVVMDTNEISKSV